MSSRPLSAFIATLFFAASGALAAPQAVDYVDPFIGTAIHTEAGLLGGGLGGNTGIAEAHNLAWKLALVLRGEAGA